MKNILNKWLAEFIWILITIVTSVLLVLPIYNAGIQFDWMLYNLIFLFGALTLIRYILYFEDHPLGKSKIFKIALICIVPLLVFPIIEGIHSFVEFNDREGLQSILTHIEPSSQTRFMQYIKIEYLFAGITCMFGSLALIVKMIRSLWRQIKFNIV